VGGESKVEVLQNNVEKLFKDIETLVSKAVYVGVPAKNAPRGDGKINNAALAYIHNFGSERGDGKKGVPARPFMLPGIEESKQRIVTRLKVTAEASIRGETGTIDANFQALGAEVAENIKKVIQRGIPPPITAAAIRSRLRDRRGQTLSPSEELYLQRVHTPNVSPLDLMSLATPLINTAALLNSIAYVIKEKGD
jgi:hypothetical protein